MSFLSGVFQTIDRRMIRISSAIPATISSIFVVLINTLFLLISPMAIHGMDGLGRWKNYSKWGIVFMLLIVLLLYRYKEQETEKSPYKMRKIYALIIGVFLGSMLVSEQWIPKVRPVYQGMS